MSSGLTQDDILLELDSLRSQICYLEDQEFSSKKELRELADRIGKYKQAVQALKINLKYIKKEAKVVSIDEFSEIIKSLNHNDSMLKVAESKHKTILTFISESKQQVCGIVDKIQHLEDILNGWGRVIQL